MSIVFQPSGVLDIAQDASDLPEQAAGNNVASDALTRCKNMRINQRGKAQTRDGSTKLNASATATPVYWIEEQGGSRFSFAGTIIYEDESSIATGMTSAQWAAIKYNSYNDTTQNIFALNGTDRKRVISGAAYEWGIAAPTAAPTLSAGQGVGLTGVYNAKYTYVRKVSGVTVAESNPSPAATAYITLSNQSLVVECTTPSDAQVTHIRLYRTQSNGAIYYHDQDITTSLYSYGVTHTWESDDAYIAGTGFKFTVSDTTNLTDDTYSWEYDFGTSIQDTPSYGNSSDWYAETEDDYNTFVAYILASGGTPISYEEFLALYA